MNRRINIRPTSGVYATYKRLSYQPWTAIAEFIDNSTQSFYDHKDELLSTKYYKGLVINIDYVEDKLNGDSLVIKDDAFGMEWSDFQRAVILDKPPKNTSGRNEFGMGLKTAACWFGSLWSVESTQLNSKNKYYTEIDIDQLEKYKTEEVDVTEETVNLKEHYTKIVIKKLNKKISGSRTVWAVKQLLSSIYREDIRSGLIKIYYNGTLLQFNEAPIFREIDQENHSKEWKKDIRFSILHDNKELKVTGFIAIRIPGSLKDAGFTLLRRGRVIVGGSEKNYRPTELFGDSNSYAYQRLFGELHMDNWPVTQAKDNFDWHNSGLEEAFIKELEKFSQDYRRKAESIRVREKINTNELVKNAVKDLSNSGLVDDVHVEIIEPSHKADRSIEDDKFTLIENNIPSDTKIDLQEEQLPEEIVDFNDDGVILEGGSQVNYKFKYRGIEYLFHIIFEMSNPTAHWLLVEENSKLEYTLQINMKHAFFKPLVKKKEFMPIMMKICIALVLAEIDSLMLSPDGKINACDIRLKMNEILEDVRKGDVSNE